MAIAVTFVPAHGERRNGAHGIAAALGTTRHSHPSRTLGLRNAKAVQRFDFHFALAYRLAARPFGITPERAWVQIDNDHLLANYGPWRLRTTLANISRVAITGPYRFYRTAGPARLGVTDGGLTFASNGERGVLLSFRDRVPAIDPLGLIRHPELTVTVANVHGLVSALSANRSPSRVSGSRFS